VVTGVTATLQLSGPINPENWTCFALVSDPGHKICLGYLPGDVDSSLISVAGDIGVLIDHLNGVGDPLPDYSVDINRDGDVGPADILRLIDVLNGAGALDPWINKELTVGCPSEG
jgi:hypothetical protein